MGNAAIYWYPSPTAGLETIDLGGALTHLDVQPVDLGASNEAVSGNVWPNPMGSYLRVRAVRENFTDHALYRKLMTLSRHLGIGGHVGLVTDTGKAWSRFAKSRLHRGQTSLPVKSAFYGSGSLVAGDEVIIESAHPEIKREWTTVASVSSSTVTLQAGLVYDYTEEPIQLTYAGFFPRLAWTGGPPIVTTDHRWSYTLDLTLRTVRVSEVLARFGGLMQDDTDHSPKANLWNLLEKEREGLLGYHATEGRPGRGLLGGGGGFK